MPAIRRLLVASSKGGVGKTTTALGLAAAFSDLGKRTLLVDLDTTSRSLDLLTGSADKALFGFGDLFTEKPVEDMLLTPFADRPELMLLCAMTGRRLRELSKERGMSADELLRAGVERVLDWDGYDMLVCDTGGGLDAACAAASCFDLTLVVSEQSRTSIRAAEYAASRLERAGADRMRLCICSFDLDAVKKEHRAGMIEMIDSSFLQCVGVVPFDKNLQSAQDRGELPAKRSPSAAAYRNIARRILGYEVPLFDGMPSYASRRKRAL